jgi:hypothetical protein
MKIFIYLAALFLLGLFLSDCSKKEEQQPCYNIEIISGNSQVGTAGQELPEPLKVRITHPNSGVGVANVEVWWFVPNGQGIANPGTSKTDANGIASTEWTLGTEDIQSLNTSVNNLFTCSSNQNFVHFKATVK